MNKYKKMYLDILYAYKAFKNHSKNRIITPDEFPFYIRETRNFKYYYPIVSKIILDLFDEFYFDEFYIINEHLYFIKLGKRKDNFSFKEFVEIKFDVRDFNVKDIKYIFFD
jgi:hypothetical protein